MQIASDDDTPGGDDAGDPENSTAAELPSGYHRTVRSHTSPPSSSGRGRRNWTVIEQFEHEGYCYRLQRRPLEATKDMPLARREEEALALASAGMTRKEIAGSLGLAPSTIGVLLHRAAAKLNAKSRRELLDSYRLRHPSQSEDQPDDPSEDDD